MGRRTRVQPGWGWKQFSKNRTGLRTGCLTILRGVLKLCQRVCICVRDWIFAKHSEERPNNITRTNKRIYTKINNLEKLSKELPRRHKRKPK